MGSFAMCMVMDSLVGAVLIDGIGMQTEDWFRLRLGMKGFGMWR